MTEIGYSLGAEEHSPATLVRNAIRCEEAGFRFALISDHYHPWVTRQRHSAFVWSVIGAIAGVTKTLRLGTGVTCPTTRIHPAIIAQADATAAALMPGRFFLGVGSGENLNEHILGDPWPPPRVRLERLEEAVFVIRKLWRGGVQNHRGRHYTVEDAEVYTLPEELPPILVAASRSKSVLLAARIGDGLVSLEPDRQLIEAFIAAGGGTKPRYGHLTVCWAEEERAARRIALEHWPNAALPRRLSTEIATPQLFEQVLSLAREEDVARSLVCGPDPEAHAAAIQRFVTAGYDHVYVHQIGPAQEGFFRFYEREILPRFHRDAGGTREPRRAADVDEALEESFPASDAPAWTLGGSSRRKRAP